MRGVFDQYLLRVAPPVDKRLIPLTKGRFSATGVNRVGLVTTTGARSRTARTHPILLIADGDGFLAMGANYGRPSHPAWTYNLLSHPECDVLFRGSQRRHRAALLDGAARDAAWATALDFYAGYTLYETRAAPREIRFFRLTPA